MKVITFSRQFPVRHPRKGEETLFVQKIWNSLIETGDISLSKCIELSKQTGIGGYTMNSLRLSNPELKRHTIRAGHRWKVGDCFSPRIWSGKPYASKQIEFAPPIHIKKIWCIEIEVQGRNIHIQIPNGKRSYWLLSAGQVAQNDGLDVHDFIEWFKVHPKRINLFQGQILCWDERLNYLSHSEISEQASVVTKAE